VLALDELGLELILELAYLHRQCWLTEHSSAARPKWP
jgi:hypothetical protein